MMKMICLLNLEKGSKNLIENSRNLTSVKNSSKCKKELDRKSKNSMKDRKNYKWKTGKKLEMMRNGYKLPNLGSNKIMINIMMRRTTMNSKVIMLKRRIIPRNFQ